jgi:hypothetical protein
MVSLLFFAFFIFAIVMIVWYCSRSWRILENWARVNNYRIVSSEFRQFFQGPFSWSPNHTVYYVKVETADGQTRSGWVRCGGWFLGLDVTEDCWDDDRMASTPEIEKP